jgi:hypothetical protein
MSLLINGLFAQSAGGRQVSALCSKNNPRNIKYMPARPVGPADRTGVVIFFACLDLERKSSLIKRLIKTGGEYCEKVAVCYFQWI